MAYDRNHYISNSERVLEAAKKRLENYEGPCEECKWSHNEDYLRRCRNPLVLATSISLTSETDARHIRDCSEQRDVKSIWGPVVCGPDGTLFEPIPPKVGLIERFLNLINGTG